MVQNGRRGLLVKFSVTLKTASSPANYDTDIPDLRNCGLLVLPSLAISLKK
jgi:hypothetical protein